MTNRPVSPPRRDTTFFFEDGAIDGLFSMVMALGAEVSALQEKLRTAVLLLERNGLIGEAEIEKFTPDPAEQAARDAERARLIRAMLLPFQHEADMLAAEAAARKG